MVIMDNGGAGRHGGAVSSHSIEHLLYICLVLHWAHSHMISINVGNCYPYFIVKKTDVREAE